MRKGQLQEDMVRELKELDSDEPPALWLRTEWHNSVESDDELYYKEIRQGM